MSVTNRITMVPFPDADRAFEFYHDSNSWFDVVSPPGHGWHLENAFLGNNVIYFIWKHGSARFDSGLIHHWTSYGDDVDTNTHGNGNQMLIENVVGISSESVLIDFIHTDTYLFGGGVTTDLQQLGNEINIEYLAKATTVNENLYGNVIIDNSIVKPSNDGTHVITDYGLVPQTDGDWDYDEETNQLVPNLGNGSYILKTDETLLSRLVNRMFITGINGQTQDIAGGNGIKLIKGGRIKITTFNNTNTDWKAYLYIYLCRNRTI